MKLKNLILIIAIALCGTATVNAQQDALYSMYMFNGVFLNPAYVGTKGGPSLTAMYRHQWSGFEGAPRSFNVSFDTPFKKELYAVGATMHYDRLGDEQKIKVDFDFAFKIKIKNESNKIALGIRGGLMHYQVKPENYQPADGVSFDQVLEQDYNALLPNFGFGIYAYGKRYYVGASIPHLINVNFRSNTEFIDEDEVARQFRHIFATAGVVLGKENGKIMFKPSILYKWSSNAPMDFDFNFSVLFFNRFWTGVSYRIGGDMDNKKGEALIALVKFKATQLIEIGYAYDHTLSKLTPFNSGSHELMIGFDFSAKSQQFVTPRYIKYF